MGSSLSKSLGLSDPLDNSIHNYLKPGPAQAPNYQAPKWWGPTAPTGMPGRSTGSPIAPGAQSIVAPGVGPQVTSAAPAALAAALGGMGRGGMGGMPVTGVGPNNAPRKLL